MRTQIIIHLILMFGLISCKSNKISYRALSNNKSLSNNKIDSVFAYHFNLLDSSLAFIKNVQYNSKEIERLMNNKDTIGLKYDYEPSMKFMEIITGLKAKSTATYFPTKILDEKIVQEWKQWYKYNYNKLVWENDMNRVNRSDKNIYILGQ